MSRTVIKNEGISNLQKNINMKLLEYLMENHIDVIDDEDISVSSRNSFGTLSLDDKIFQEWDKEWDKIKNEKGEKSEKGEKGETVVIWFSIEIQKDNNLGLPHIDTATVFLTVNIATRHCVLTISGNDDEKTAYYRKEVVFTFKDDIIQTMLKILNVNTSISYPEVSTVGVSDNFYKIVQLLYDVTRTDGSNSHLEISKKPFFPL